MDRESIIRKLSKERPALQVLGLNGVSLLGSAARKESGVLSDVDIAVTLDEQATLQGSSC
jgi:predicted nucleotidyltransferase